MPGTEGNQNAVKSKRMLTDALKRELTQRPDDVLAIANRLIDSAKAGEPWAMTLIHDRVDGKAPQPIVGDDSEDPIRIGKVARELVRPNPANPDG